MSHRTVALTLAAALAACGGPPEGIQDRVSLKPFKSCKELEAYVKDTAVRELRAGATTSGGISFPTTLGASMARSAAPSASNGFGEETASVPDHSQTNTQVGGVDEADFVKTDGLRTFYLTGGRLLVLKTWPANETALLATVPIDGWPREMFLADKRLVVFSGTASWTYDDTVARPLGLPGPMNFHAQSSGEDATRITVFDVSSDTPVELQSYLLGGVYASSRRIGSAVRVVLAGALSYPTLEPVPGGGVLSGFGLDLDRDRALAENERRLRGRSLADFLPGTFVSSGGTRVEVPFNCSDFYQPNVAARLGLATVATLDLDALEGGVSQTSIVTQVGEIYASEQALYIASPHWWWAGLEGRHDHTYLHKLDLQARDKVSYVASGGVSGRIVDQFSMDEHEGFFRVAATTQQWGARSVLATTDTRVCVLAERSGRLVLLGNSENLAPGEQIYSSRFSGTKGFVVTFRRVDPLFTLDLSDPVAPKVMGALELPGVSTYIQVLDERRLLTIGSTSGTCVGCAGGGVMLQLFDVSDLSAPRLTAKEVVGTFGGSSEAQLEHKAFNYFEKTGVLAIPFTDWARYVAGQDYWSQFVSSLKVYKIDAGAIRSLGEVDHREFYRDNNRHDWAWWYLPQIRRSVQVEGFVYSFSSAGMKVNDTANLATTVKRIPFPLER